MPQYVSSDGCSWSLMTESDQHPCNTLFVGNLKPQNTPDDLTTAFSGCKGFLRARIESCLNTVGRSKYDVNFVEFEDLRSSYEAMCEMQGYILPGSHRNSGIIIEYTREKMRWGNVPSTCIPVLNTTDSPGHNPMSSAGGCMHDTSNVFQRRNVSQRRNV